MIKFNVKHQARLSQDQLILQLFLATEQQRGKQEEGHKTQRQENTVAIIYLWNAPSRTTKSIQVLDVLCSKSWQNSFRMSATEHGSNEPKNEVLGYTQYKTYIVMCLS